MRSNYLYFVFLLISIPCFSQLGDSIQVNTTSSPLSTPKIITKYKSTSISLPYRSVRDEGQSPLTYKRLTYQLSVYNERLREKSITKLEFTAGLGFLRTNKNEVSVITSAPMLMLEINYQYLQYIKSIFNNKGALYIGGILSNTLDGRLYTSLQNNSFGYEFSNVLNPATQLYYTFTLGEYRRKYQLGFKGSAALLAHVIRPNFIGMEPVQAYEGESISVGALFIHNNKIAFPNRFFRLNTEIYFDRFQLSNDTKIRLFYSWGFHSTKLIQSNNLYASFHSLGITSMIYSSKSRHSIFKRKITPKP